MSVLSKYRDYSSVIVSGHGMMTKAVIGSKIELGYGQIAEFEL